MTGMSRAHGVAVAVLAAALIVAGTAAAQQDSESQIFTPGQDEAVSYISRSSYMMPCVEYSGKITRSMPGRPIFMPSIISAILRAFARTSSFVCRRGIL